MINDTIDLLQIQIEKARTKLSPETRQAIDSVDWKQVIVGMRESKVYNIEQLGDLALETELLLSGLLSPEQYPKELETRLKITKNQVDVLVNDMNTLVFKKIKDELIRIVDKNKTTKKIISSPLEKEKLSETFIKPHTSQHEEIFRNAGIEIVQNLETPELEAPEMPVEIEAHKEAPISYKVESSKVPKEETNTPIIASKGSKPDSIIMQKLSGTVQMPKVDPYRMPIE